MTSDDLELTPESEDWPRAFPSEEEWLDECAEYCTKHVVNRLRIMPYEMEVAE